MDDGQKGYIFAILSSLMMSAAVVINYIALQSVSVVSLTFYFFGFGLFGAIILLIATRKLYITKQLFRQYWKPVAFLGLIGGTTALVWFFALKLVGSSTMGFLMRFSTVFTVGLAVMLLKERLNRTEIFGGLITIIGAAVMMFKGTEHIVLGVALALAISFIVSLEQFLMKNYVKRIEPMVFNALRLAFTFLPVAVYAIYRMDLTMPSSNIMWLIFLGSILSTVIGFVFYFKALEVAELSKVAIIRALDPFVIFIYSLILLGSVPTGMQLIGGMLIGMGALILVLARHKPKIIVKLLPNF